MSDQAQKLRELAKAGLFDCAVRHRSGGGCRTIAVTSGKGGVGKTNISLALAVTLARMKKRVLLLDADFGLANVHILLGTAPRFNLFHLIRGEATLDEIIGLGPEGIELLPGASGIEELANLDGAKLGQVMDSLVTLEERYDFIVVDTAAGIGSGVTRFAINADLPLLVLTPEPTSLADAYAMVKVLYEHDVKRVAVAVNLASSDREAVETFDRLNTLVVRFLHRGVVLYGSLPVDRGVSRFVRRQRVAVLEEPNSSYARKIQLIARKIAQAPATEEAGFFSRFRRKGIGGERSGKRNVRESGVL